MEAVGTRVSAGGATVALVAAFACGSTAWTQSAPWPTNDDGSPYDGRTQAALCADVEGEPLDSPIVRSIQATSKEERESADAGYLVHIQQGGVRDEKLDDQAARSLARVLASSSTSNELLVAVAPCLRWAEDHPGLVLPPVARLLDDPSRPDELHRALLWGLAMLGRPAAPAIDQIERHVASSTAATAQMAHIALGAVVDPEDPNQLARLLEGPDWSTRLTGYRELAALGSKGAPAVPALSRALRSARWDEREEAARALGFIASADGVPALTEALQTTNWRLQLAAAHALGRIGETDSLGVLGKLERSHWSRPVREAGARARAWIRAGKWESLRPQRWSEGPQPTHDDLMREDIHTGLIANHAEGACPKYGPRRVRYERRWVAVDESWHDVDEMEHASDASELPAVEKVPGRAGPHHRVDDGWLAALGRGFEDGGELYFVDTEGNAREIWHEGGVYFFAELGDRVVVVAGQRHLVATATLIAFRRGPEGHWVAEPVIELPAAPRKFLIAPNGKLLVSDDYQVYAVDTAGQLEMLRCESG